MAKIQVLFQKTCMIAAYILYLVQVILIPGPHQGKCITLELYFTFKLPANEDAAFTFTFNRPDLVISGHMLH